MRPYRPLLLSLAAAAGTAVLPAVAEADSIVFLRGGNLWIANVDGSGARAITTDGVVDGDTEYKAVSAAKGSGAPMLGYRQGGEIGYIRADGSGKQPLPGTENPSIASSAEIDPTGRRVAWVQQDTSYNYFWRTKNADGSDERTSGTEGVDHATWADAGTRALTSELHGLGAPYPSEDGCPEDTFNLVAGETQPVGGNGPDEVRDFTCVAQTNLYDPGVSPDFGRVAAAAASSAGGPSSNPPTRIMVLPLAAGMQQGSYVTPEGINATNPDWSTNASTIVFEGSDNTVWTVPAGGGTPVKILDDAQDPAWTPFGGGGAPGGGTGGGGTTPGGDDPGSAEQLSLVLRKGIKLKPSLRNGFVLAGQVASAARLNGKITIDKATAKRYKLGKKKKTLDKAATVARQAGSYSLEFEFSKKERRKLKKAASVTFRVKVKATFADGTTDKVRGKVTLKK